MAVQYLGVDGDEIWCGEMGIAGEKRGRRNARKVYQMDTGGGLENAGVYGERGSEEGQTEYKGEEESIAI